MKTKSLKTSLQKLFLVGLVFGAAPWARAQEAGTERGTLIGALAGPLTTPVTMFGIGGSLLIYKTVQLNATLGFGNEGTILGYEALVHMPLGHIMGEASRFALGVGTAWAFRDNSDDEDTNQNRSLFLEQAGQIAYGTLMVVNDVPWFSWSKLTQIAVGISAAKDVSAGATNRRWYVWPAARLHVYF